MRKKKCDETRPLCHACLSLDIFCHGYGAKPVWMDNGTLQQDQALKFKRMIRQNKLRRESQNQSSMGRTLRNQGMEPSLSLNVNKNLPTGCTVILSLNSTSTQHIDRWDNDIPQDQLLCQLSETNTASSPDPIWTAPWNLDDRIATDSLFGQTDYTPEYKSIQSEGLGHDSFLPTTSGTASFLAPNLPIIGNINPTLSDIVPQDGSHATADGETLNTSGDMTSSVSRHEHHFHMEPTSSNRPGSEPTSGIFGQLKPRPGVPKLILGVEVDDALFMHYLDEVFYIQFPFYHSSGKQGRGWLYSMLRRDKSSYHAALAVSERHLLLTKPQENDIMTSLAHLGPKDRHYNFAIREMRNSMETFHSWNESIRLARSFEGLSTALQLMFLEVCQPPANVTSNTNINT